MAATFTEVTLDDMERFLKRAYRALRPKKGESRGEVYYDLNLSDNKIFVRIWTSIRPKSGVGAEKGADAIRVTMITKGGKALMPKGKIVKRTQNWRSNLQDRIEDLLETYESKTDYWKGRQQNRDESAPEQKEEKQTPPKTAPPAPSGVEIEGQFTRLRDGGWGAKIFNQGSPGDVAYLSTKQGRRVRVTLDIKVWSGKDRYTNKDVEVWSISQTGGSRYAATDEKGNPVDLTSILVAEAYGL